MPAKELKKVDMLIMHGSYAIVSDTKYNHVLLNIIPKSAGGYQRSFIICAVKPCIFRAGI